MYVYLHRNQFCVIWLTESVQVDEWLFVPSDAEMKEMWKSLLERRPQFEDIKFTKIKCVYCSWQTAASQCLTKWLCVTRKPSLLSSKLVELEELITQRRKIKIGVLRALGGQTNDDQMFSNRTAPSWSSTVSSLTLSFPSPLFLLFFFRKY
jgi:hypothetical protein